MIPIKRVNPIKPAKRGILLLMSICSAFPERTLNAESKSKTRINAKIKEMIENIIDSPKNCLIRFARFAPTTFLNPISKERPLERAVVRFMKLTHAMSMTKSAIIVKL